MYKVTCDGKPLHDNYLQNLKIEDGELTLELGKTGAFEFTIYPNHPYYDSVRPVISVIEVYRNELSIFRGRALSVKYGFYNEKQVFCEGELAFLLDSIVPPHVYSGSFVQYLDYILDIHNAQVEPEKQFAVGNRTVAEFYPFDVEENFEFMTSFDTISKRMAEYSGGYLQARHKYGTMYLDLLAPDMDISNVSAQKIRLGKNLLDIRKEIDGSEVFSGIVPLGAKIGDTETRVDIFGVNGGSYSITNADAVAAYGKIFKTVIFENITSPSELLSEASRYLAEKFASVNTIEITAADLSGVNPDLDSFDVGQWVEVVSGIHFNEPQTFLIRKMSIKISNPADTKIEVGRTKQGLVDRLGDVTGSISDISDSVSDALARATSAVDAAKSATATLESRPYIKEAGTTGIWKWKKYSDNTCEFFGKVPVTNAAVSTALGGWYRGETLFAATDYAYPFTMTEAPALEVTFQTRNGLAAIAWVFSQDASTAQQYLPQCYLIRPTTATGIYGNINIVGKGKL